MKIKIFFLCLLTLGCICSASEQSAEIAMITVKPDKSQIDSVLVSIDGEPITLLDVILETSAQERELAAVYTGERYLTELQALRKSTLEKIIFRRLLYKKYLENPFPVPPQEIENMIDHVSGEYGVASREMLELKMKEMGTTMSQLKKRVTEKFVTDVILYHLCDKNVNVTPKDVYDEYVKKPEEWTKPEQINLQLLRLLLSGGHTGNQAREYADSIKNKVLKADYAAFVSYAEEYSDAVNADNPSALTGFMDRSKLRPEFEKALKGKKVGQVIGPVETPEAIYFIRIAGIEKEQKIPFTSISETIRKRLVEEATAKERERYKAELSQTAVIRYYVK